VALRVTLARTICGGSYRAFAARLADSTLLQWFCRIERMGRLAKIPGKSQLQRYQGMVQESELREVVEGLLELAAEEDSALEMEVGGVHDTVGGNGGGVADGSAGDGRPKGVRARE